MSRFYEVLKQASRAVHTPQEEPQPGKNATVPPEISELLETVNASGTGKLSWTAAATQETAAAAAAIGEPAPLSEAVAEPLAAESGQPAEARNGSFGTPARTHLDQTSRLLPHTVDSMIAEHYRLLRTQLLQAQASRMFRSLLITSAGPGEGKTVTLLNLGLTFAMLPSFRVLVVDGDLRRGSIGSWLGASADQPGFSDLLQGSVSLEDVVLQSDEIPIRFMVRGTSRIPPAELLHSPRLHSSLHELSQRFDLVLVDSPPVNLLTDPQLLASACDAVLLVARAYATTQKALQEAANKLQPFHLVGSVLNGAVSLSSSYGYRSYY
ncbi:MAG TPA: CpsD/CapB family tyrosine-protein kinase [Terriglobia bacterium]|nr:CpsD/CapB family tyrosine-protein kinase [Terriglobia bacterium]